MEVNGKGNRYFILSQKEKHLLQRRMQWCSQFMCVSVVGRWVGVCAHAMKLPIIFDPFYFPSEHSILFFFLFNERKKRKIICAFTLEGVLLYSASTYLQLIVTS